MDNTELRLKLFKLFSKNLESLHRSQKWQLFYPNEDGKMEKVSDIYICPICFEYFNEFSLDQNEKNPLTLEDVPPKSLGGRPITLTCKRCNNHIGGSKIDSQLYRKQLIEPFINAMPGSEINVDFEINNHFKIRGIASYLSNASELKFSFNKKSNHNLVKELENLKNRWSGSVITYKFSLPSNKLVFLGYLKMAYLKMFSYFGYGYIYSTSAESIRKIIFHHNTDLEFDKYPISFVPFNEDKLGVSYAYSPPDLNSFLVTLKFKINNSLKYVSILLPGPNERISDFANRIINYENNKIELYSLEDHDILTNESKTLYYFKSFAINT